MATKSVTEDGLGPGGRVQRNGDAASRLRLGVTTAGDEGRRHEGAAGGLLSGMQADLDGARPDDERHGGLRLEQQRSRTTATDVAVPSAAVAVKGLRFVAMNALGALDRRPRSGRFAAGLIPVFRTEPSTILVFRSRRGARCGADSQPVKPAAREATEIAFLKRFTPTRCSRNCDGRSLQKHQSSIGFKTEPANYSKQINWEPLISTGFKKRRELVRDQGVGGSNPLSPTNIIIRLRTVFSFRKSPL
jgi:hypothetical protein